MLHSIKILYLSENEHKLKTPREPLITDLLENWEMEWEV